MNNLRRIMQKLASAQTDLPSDARPADTNFLHVLNLRIQDYEDHLGSCSEAMLQYEWAWLEEHIEDLKLCLIQPEMLETLGGKVHVERLLIESQECKEHLEAVMRSQNVQPACHSHAVSSSDHAWNVQQDSIKKAWGF